MKDKSKSKGSTEVSNLNKEVVKQIDEKVVTILGSHTMRAFEKAYLISDAIEHLKEVLTDEYMRPIMSLQGSRLGFKTDKDDRGGYDINTVRVCLIDAVLSGVQPTGNQFNILEGNMYITKEGFKFLLDGIEGLKREITFEMPRMDSAKGSGAVVANIRWTINGQENIQKIDIPVKVKPNTGVDGIIGKATRKASAWLYNTINGTDFGDGEVADAEVVSSKRNRTPFDSTLETEMPEIKIES
jgi:hypothetical protein